MQRKTQYVALAVMGFVVLNTSLHAQVLTTTAVKDNSIYNRGTGQFSNGAGQIFAGLTNAGIAQRGLLQFDLRAIPSNAQVTGVTLTMHLSRGNGGVLPVTLHRVLQDWGEGTSVNNGGGGAAATNNDATWNFRFYNAANPGASSAWTNPGGDFFGTASASQDVGDYLQTTGTVAYTWGSSSGMMADVQGWVNNSANNFGWLVRGFEDVSGTTKRFVNREDVNIGLRPALTVTYTTVPEPGVWGLCAGVLVGGGFLLRRRFA